MQVYVSLPQDESGKEYRRLAGFAKTKLLKPGEKELLKIRIDRKTLAYFSEEQHAWIAEKGYYAVWVGNSIASLTLAAMLEVPESVILIKRISLRIRLILLKKFMTARIFLPEL